MRAGRRLFAIAVGAIALASLAPLAHGDTPTIPQTAIASEWADRGRAIQVTETMPPPVTVPGDSLDLPADSGTGRRVVYSKTIMRVWMIEEDGTIFHTHRVSGLLSQPNPGTYKVFSRSANTCSATHAGVCMRWMVRFTKGRAGDNIGFHEIPNYYGTPMQTVEDLGLGLSLGCVRQAPDDALLMWDWAQLGTVVVVTP